MNKGILIFLSVIILMIVLASAVEFIPQGDINLMNVYQVKNATNITAQYFIGDGSLITGIAGSGDINGVFTDRTPYLEGGVASGNANLTFNETLMNLTIDDRIILSGSSSNASWNQSLADTLYSPFKWGYNFTISTYNLYNSVWLSTYNATYDKWAYNMSDGVGSTYNYSLATQSMWDSIWLSTYNATYDKWAYNMSDGVGSGNESWNESRANLLYSNIKWGYNFTISTYNLYNGVWSSTYNATYDKWAYNMSDGIGSGNESWNESRANLLYAGIEWDYNQTTSYTNGTGLNLTGTIFSILNSFQFPQNCNDGEIAEYNTTSGGWDCAIDNSASSGMASWVLAATGTGGSESITDGETVTFDGDYYLVPTRVTNTVTYNFNETRINSTIDNRASVFGNLSWNQSLANILYADIKWDYNETQISDAYTDNQLTGYIPSGNIDSWILKYQNISNFPTCSGTDKLTFDGTTLSCGTDVDTNGVDTWGLNLSSGISGNLIPLSDSTFNIGSTTLRWITGWFDNIVTGEINASVIRSDDWSNVTIVESQITNLAHIGNNGITLLEANITDLSHIGNNGITLLEANITDLEHIGNNGITLVEANITDLVHTTDTTAATICAGTTTYLDGEANCDDISGVYVDVSGDTMTGDLAMNGGNTTNTNDTRIYFGSENQAYMSWDSSNKRLIIKVT